MVVGSSVLLLGHFDSFLGNFFVAAEGHIWVGPVYRATWWTTFVAERLVRRVVGFVLVLGVWEDDGRTVGQILRFGVWSFAAIFSGNLRFRTSFLEPVLASGFTVMRKL